MNNIQGSNINNQNDNILPVSQFDNTKKNCINFNANLRLHELTGLEDDPCLMSEENRQSINPGNYRLNNFHSCDCDITNILNTASDNVGITVKDGFGISECNVDNDSKLRVGRTRKYPKCMNQLYTRPYLTVPYMGRGSGNSNVESKLKTSGFVKPGQHLAGVNIPNFFTPLVPNLENNVQNPYNIVESSADPDWVRGGVPSRQIVKDIDYLARSHDCNEYKDYLLQKKPYIKDCLN